MRSAPSIVCFSFSCFDLKELPDLAMVAPQLSSRMNWQQRSGQIYANLMEPGLRPCDSGSHRIAKSSVHRLVQGLSVAISIQNRPVNTEWLPVVTHGLGSGVCVRSQAGHWQRDVVRILPYFAFRGRIGVSTPLQVRAQIEQQILNYRDEQQAQLQQRQARVEVCVGADETF